MVAAPHRIEPWNPRMQSRRGRGQVLRAHVARECERGTGCRLSDQTDQGERNEGGLRRDAKGTTVSSAPRGHSVLLIVENCSVPFDTRVWREAVSLRDAGYDVSVISPLGPTDTARHELRDGVHIYRHPLESSASSTFGYLGEYASALVWELRLALALSRSGDVDVVQICNPPDVLFLVAGILKAMTGCSVIFDHHDLSPELFIAKFQRKGMLHILLRLAERATFATADVVLSTNESYREIALTRGGKSADAVYVVRNGPRTSDVVRMEPNDGLRHGRRFLVGYVGMIAEQDGLDLLLEAAHHLVHARRRDDVQFLIVGDGPMKTEVRNLAETLGLADYVTFAGFITGARLREMISSMDVCVGPDAKNQYNDASTMVKAVEAMAFGKPFVQFDLVEGRRTAGAASLYATSSSTMDLGDKIALLLDDASLRRQMSEFAVTAFHDRLSWDVQEPELLRAYRRAVAATERRRRRRRRLLQPAWSAWLRR